MEEGAGSTDTAAANGGTDASQTVVQVEDVQPNSVSAAEKEAEANQEIEAPRGILKTPQAFEDGIQHAVEPQEYDVEAAPTEK